MVIFLQQLVVLILNQNWKFSDSTPPNNQRRRPDGAGDLQKGRKISTDTDINDTFSDESSIFGLFMNGNSD